MVSNMGGAPKKNPTAEQHHKRRSVKLQRHYIVVYLPQKKLEPSLGSRQQFKAGSNLKGSFILLDACPLNP
ncbi:hypothetical protein M0R45_034034 [Rubus argutus]|uniref:Uncharacterized protein n=1 Tax=Rubus argutus TaxID=59490 RepID=A0AAW1VNZ1_RUBAR